ncbi:MAG: 23S rRNA (adenine(2503)-C(2))-methyltransferase RlmN [Firmicutes bacterium]|nr:23S rRNA (adenine(2503)-C(2))-methyltransferase RlmN [Bacillota bacterium]
MAESGGKERRTELLGLTLAEAREFFERSGHPPYRADQVFDWVYSKRREDPREMTNLPLALREWLAGAIVIGLPGVVTSTRSRDGGATKYLFGLADGNAVEGVLMRHDYGLTACVSSQVGCKMACGFCASAAGGFVRNLGAAEMVGQVTSINRALPPDRRVARVALMGSGEPLDNYANCLRFIRIINEPAGLNIGMRHITLSTCGIVPGIKRLQGEGLPITLGVSLHAPNDELRSRLMPVAGQYPLGELVATCRDYANATGRRVSFEYALIDGVNDGHEHVRELARLLKGGLFHVNLIPYNPVEGRPFRTSPPAKVKEFISLLENMGIAVTVRRGFGTDLDAACGQLRRRRGSAGGV